MPNRHRSQQLTLPRLTRYHEGRHGVDDALMIRLRNEWCREDRPIDQRLTISM
ncbi:hypothetical protein H0178_57205 [Cytobacillus firmus]|nr:hypothetical protein [Cytobacillus firmus]